MGGLCSLFLAYVGSGVPPIRERPAVFDQPRADILTVGNASGNHAAIAVDILLFATNGMSVYVVGKGKRCLIAASTLYAGKFSQQCVRADCCCHQLLIR